ncbi:MAG: FtsX-like permease family protein [Sphingobacteriales bacterium]|nr:MAG: FtsX-like permease family protein [Sphingobacteriales bacterium]
MIAASFIVYQQLNYIRNKNLGLNKDQVLTFHIDNQELREKCAAIKEAFLRNPLIESVSAASNPIGNNNIGSNGIFFEEESKSPGEAGSISTSSRKTQNFMVDGDYLNTLEIKLVAGRNYSEQRQGDKIESILVNETLVKELGWTEPIGKKVKYYINNEGKLGQSIVVGVVKDFHIYSLQHKLEPLILQMPQEETMKDNLYVKVSSQNIPAALEYLKKTYQQFDPSSNPEFRFLSENFNAQYQSEQKQGTLLLILTILAISIACLGLFGLVTFTAIQKAKEIGIRKVLGASVAGIVKLLSADLLKLVVIAFLIATPIAWIAMKYWLQDFAYQVKINWSVFLFAGGTALLIALITLSIQAIRSAVANPVKSLKAE